eukprot:scaffold45948_cov58-Phaeocystis_antarctica.AAC.2
MRTCPASQTWALRSRCASACAFCPHSRAGPHTHAACAADSPFPFCASSMPCVSSLIECPLWTRQYANAFNQPLSFDTSSVTTMGSMFEVRFRLRLLPPLPSRATHARRVRC